MPAKDRVHDLVKRCIIKDGWNITHDPFTISFGVRKVYADLGAEKLLIAAEKASQKIVVEIKSFASNSIISELEKAIGQYEIYKSWLTRIEPERVLYLALDHEAYIELFTDISGQVLLQDYQLKLITFNSEKEVIEQWIK